MCSRKQRYKTKIIIVLPLLFFCVSFSNAQRKGNVFYTNDRIEIGAGTGLLLNVIPLSLGANKNLHIPSGEFGPAGGLKFKHSFTKNFAMGYQLDVLKFAAKVYEDGNGQIARTGTNVYGNSLTIEYYLKNMFYEDYRYNVNVYYKIGFLALKLTNGRIKTGTTSKSVSLSDVGVGLLTGVGVGISYVINEQWSLSWRNDYNHILSSFEDFYRVDRIFTNTEHTVSHYGISTLGICYRFKKEKKVTSKYYLPFSTKKKRK